MVIFYRPRKFLGSAGIHYVHGENFSVPLYDGSYFPYLSIVGEKEFWVKSCFGSKFPRIIDVKSGQTYYFRYEMGFFKVYFVEAESETAERELAEYLKLCWV